MPIQTKTCKPRSTITVSMLTEHGLASYAACEANSRGRLHHEKSSGYRSEFQRDRDRIIHSAAFRRLEYKTQVFVNHEGDLFRTRLTHSLEVAQIARTIARVLNLNEHLAEAISLAHDLGHTPFGHAGQDALNACMKDYGGFEHNLQSLRVVDELEEKYAQFDGLNLCFETREGILKHCSKTNARQLGDLGKRFLDRSQPSLEAQLANVADEIAYNNHDVDDGVRSGLITLKQLNEVPLFANFAAKVQAQYPDLSAKRLRHEVIRRMINHLVTDLIESSRQRIETADLKDIDSVRQHGSALIGFSQPVANTNRVLKKFLHENLYRHYRVQRMSNKAQRIIQALFETFFDNPHLLPNKVTARRSQSLTDEAKSRMIADYIAGMTDRYAIDEHERIFNPRKSG